MEFITNREKNIYTVPNNLNNKYIITFLSQYSLISSTSDSDNDDFITITTNSIETLEDFEKGKDQSDKDIFINKFIYDIGCQILLLKANQIGIKHFNLSDIIVLNSNIFLFINPNMLYNLLNKKEVDDSLPEYTHGTFTLDSIDSKSLFLPPEFSEKNKYYYYTTSYYSFAKLLLHYFDIKISDIENSSLYFFCKRCLIETPIDRVFLFI
jgi:hypothetical protein